MTEMAAAMGLGQLGKLEDLNSKRIKNSLYLISELKNGRIDWLTLPWLRDNVKHTFFWCPIVINEDNLGMSTQELIIELRERGIETRHRYKEPLYKQRLLTEKSPYPKGFPFNSKHYDKAVDYGSLHLPNVERIAGRVIGLPNHPKLGREELDRVVEAIRSIR